MQYCNTFFVHFSRVFWHVYCYARYYIMVENVCSFFLYSKNRANYCIKFNTKYFTIFFQKKHTFAVFWSGWKCWNFNVFLRTHVYTFFAIPLYLWIPYISMYKPCISLKYQRSGAVFSLKNRAFRGFILRSKRFWQFSIYFYAYKF